VKSVDKVKNQCDQDDDGNQCQHKSPSGPDRPELYQLRLSEQSTRHRKTFKRDQKTVWDKLRAMPGGVPVKIRLTLLNSSGNVNQRDPTKRDVWNQEKAQQIQWHDRSQESGD
jgi:hypothetical protein